MNRKNLIKVLVSGAVLVGLLAAAFPVFAAPVSNEAFVTDLQANGNLATLAGQGPSEAFISNLLASEGAYTQLANLQFSFNQNAYSFRAQVGESSITEPYVSNLAASGQLSMLGK